MSERSRDVVDALEADMAEHQRRFSGEATPDSNRRLAADAVERLEREQAATRAPAVQPPPNGEPPIVRQTREIAGARYIMDVRPDQPLLRKANEAEHWFLVHAMPRVELLMTKLDTGPMGQPSWRDRVMAVLYLKSQVPGARAAGLLDHAAELERRFTFELMQLLEESSATFGDWKKDAPTKVTVSG